MSIDRLFREEAPVLPRRGVHLDLKGLPPTPGRMVELIDSVWIEEYLATRIEPLREEFEQPRGDYSI